MQLINKDYIEIAQCSYDDASSPFIAAPDISTYGKLRFATVVQAPKGAAVHGVTPLAVGDQIFTRTSWDDGKWRNVIPTSDVLGFWHPSGGKAHVTPVGERVVVQSGYFVSSSGHYGCSLDDLPQSCGIVQEMKLGEHCVLRAVSLGSNRYDELLPGINRRCYIEHLGSHGDIDVVIFGREVLLFVPVGKVEGVTVSTDHVKDGINRVADPFGRNGVADKGLGFGTL